MRHRILAAFLTLFAAAAPAQDLAINAAVAPLAEDAFSFETEAVDFGGRIGRPPLYQCQSAFFKNPPGDGQAPGLLQFVPTLRISAYGTEDPAGSYCHAGTWTGGFEIEVPLARKLVLSCFLSGYSTARAPTVAIAEMRIAPMGAGGPAPAVLSCGHDHPAGDVSGEAARFQILRHTEVCLEGGVAHRFQAQFTGFVNKSPTSKGRYAFSKMKVNTGSFLIAMLAGEC